MTYHSYHRVKNITLDHYTPENSQAVTIEIEDENQCHEITFFNLSEGKARFLASALQILEHVPD